MKTKFLLGLAVLVVLLVGSAWWFTRVAPEEKAPATTAASSTLAAPAAVASAPAQGTRTHARPSDDVDRDVVDGRVLHAVTHEGVANAELTFVGDAGVSTFKTSSDGTFVLTPAATGTLTLSTVTAPGFVSYAPELERGGVRVTLARGPAVHGVTLLLHPAVDYQGRVLDARGAPVRGARVHVLGIAVGDPVRDLLAAEWTSGPDGTFTFQAADDAVLEARRGSLRGTAQLDRSARALKAVTIRLGSAPPRDATITGRVRDSDGAPIAEALVRASPSAFANVPTVFATTGADGAFTLLDVDRASYDLTAEAEDRVRGLRFNVLGGTRNVEITLDTGVLLAGHVVDRKGAPVPMFTLLVRRHVGAARPVIAHQPFVDPAGRFSVRVPRGDYDLLASARGCACGTPIQASAGMTDVRVVLGAGGTVRGRVISSEDRAPIRDAKVTCETLGARDSASLADAGTVTRADGSFELSGIPAGPMSIRVEASGYHGWIESAMTASDGAALGPVTIELTRVGPEDFNTTELVGIGVGLMVDGDALRITNVVPFGGAFDAGILYGERLLAVDGVPVSQLGIDGVVARLRGAAGVTVRLTVERDGRRVDVIVERRRLRGGRLTRAPHSRSRNARRAAFSSAVSRASAASSGAT